MHWSLNYVGKTPEEIGFCWGLLRTFYAGHNIQLPVIPGLTKENHIEIAEACQRVLVCDWEQVPEPFEGAAVAMSVLEFGDIHHVGIWTDADGGRIVHCWGDHRVVADTLRGLKQKGLKQIKFYRHKSWPHS